MRLQTPLFAALGLALAGCGSADEPFEPDRPAQPVVATVVVKVPGMS